jgi:hypothetical protein
MGMPPGIADEEQEPRHWLGMLRDGTREQKAVARLVLARIYEGRGRPDHAIGLLESSARAGVRDRALFTRLAALYRRAGRDADADAALVEAAATLGRQLGPARPTARSARWPAPGRRPAERPAPRKEYRRPGTLYLACLAGGGLVLLLALAGVLGGAGGGRSAGTLPSAGTAEAPVAIAPQVSERQSTLLPTVGESAEGGNWSVSLRRVGTAAILQNVLGETRAGGRFVIVTMQVTNTAPQPAVLNARDFNLVTADGTRYGASRDGRAALRGDPRPIILAEQVQPGQSRDLREVFDVDPATSDVTLEAPGDARFRVTVP